MRAPTLSLLALGCLPGALSAQEPRPSKPALSAAEVDFFERRIRPILAGRCYKCHSQARDKHKGELVLDSRQGWQTGGASGPALVPGKPDESRLIQAVRYGSDLQMPPKNRLPKAEVDLLVEWVRRGAPDPREADAPLPKPSAMDLEAGRRHWAFHPLADTQAPSLDRWPGSELPPTEIDRFILARLQQGGLRPAPQADRRSLLRRASFDLTGLPPSEAEVRAFLRDAKPGAFARVVDRLLASAQFGVRWGRIWLDLARYSDSNGLDENLALANAWRYRDWVVRAFNADLPYDEFVRMQVAGDLLPIETGDPGAARQKRFDNLTATGFLLLGPKMLAEQDKDKMIMDIVDEQIDVTCRAVLGMTAGCARCHDHKFDPIPARDYYALAGVFKSTKTMADLRHLSRWLERPLETKAEAERRAQWGRDHEQAQKAYQALRNEARDHQRQGLRQDLARYLLAAERLRGEYRFIEAESAYRSNLEVFDHNWGSEECVVVVAEREQASLRYRVEVAAAGTYALQIRYASRERRPMRLELNGELVKKQVIGKTTGGWRPPHQRWEQAAVLELRAGRNEIALSAPRFSPHLDKLLLVPCDASGQQLRWPDPGEAGLEAETLRDLADYLGRPTRKTDPLFAPWTAFAALHPADWSGQAAALRDRLLRAPDRLAAPVQDLLAGPSPQSLRELAGRYQTLIALLDRQAEAFEQAREARQKNARPPAFAALHEQLFGRAAPLDQDQARVGGRVPSGLAEQLRAARQRLEQLEKQRPPTPPSVLAVTDQDQVGDVGIHGRGSHLSESKVKVPRGFLRILDHQLPQPPVGKGESGRLQLARWLTDPRNALTARVIVNRLWAGLFGRGIVDSPSNFGTRGAQPTHPALLDHLARSLIADGWSLKRQLRRIMLSHAYQMGSDHDEEAAAADPENRLFWRQNRRRLQAEMVRDALLASAGKLDLELGGSMLGTRNRGYVTNEHSRNQAQYDSLKRSLYLPIIRTAMYEGFTIFDYSDPSVPIARRHSTAVANQALFMLNSPLVMDMAAALAKDILAQPGSEQDRIHRIYRRVLQRRASPGEQERALGFLRKARKLDQGPPESWQALCQVVLASSEFLYID